MESRFDLDRRTGLPEDLRDLLARYPRDVWSGHRHLGPTAQFWLARHAMFRELGGGLDEGLRRHREGLVDLAGFRGWFTPRLGFFLQQLEEHHRIEDEHYFPVFQRAERRLAHGFELLEADHEVIHHDLVAVARTARLFLAAPGVLAPSPDDEARRSADAYAEAGDRLLRRLIRHLADEEDLIIPLILDRGEAAIGI